MENRMNCLDTTGMLMKALANKTIWHIMDLLCFLSSFLRRNATQFYCRNTSVRNLFDVYGYSIWFRPLRGEEPPVLSEICFILFKCKSHLSQTYTVSGWIQNIYKSLNLRLLREFIFSWIYKEWVTVDTHLLLPGVISNILGIMLFICSSLFHCCLEQFLQNCFKKKKKLGQKSGISDSITQDNEWISMPLTCLKNQPFENAFGHFNQCFQKN